MQYTLSRVSPSEITSISLVADVIHWLKQLQPQYRYLALKVRSHQLSEAFKNFKFHEYESEVYKKVESATEQKLQVNKMHLTGSKKQNKSRECRGECKGDVRGDVRGNVRGDVRGEWKKECRIQGKQVKREHLKQFKDGIIEDMNFDSKVRRKNSDFSQRILDSLVFVSDGGKFHESICFDYPYIQNPEKLQDLFRGEWKFSSIDSIDSIDSLHHALSIFRDEVLNSCKIYMLNPAAMAIDLETEKSKKKQFSLHWKSISEESRKRILFLRQSTLLGLYQTLRKDGIELSQSELYRQITELLMMENHEFCNKILKTKLKRCLTEQTKYHELIYREWKTEADKIKRSKYRRISRQKKAKDEQLKRCKSNNSVESNETNETDGMRVSSRGVEEKSIHQHEIQISEVIKKMPSTSSMKKCPTYSEEKLLSTPEKSIESTLENASTTSSPEHCIPYFTSEVCLSDEEITPQVIIHKAHLQRKQSEFFTQQLEELSDQISEGANQYHQRRLIAFSRIQYILSWFPIKLFGSCASGIAIKNSDIDIAVDNCILTYFGSVSSCESVTSTAFEWLHETLRVYPFVTSMKLIKTAKIPLIKMSIDTSIPFQNAPELSYPHNSGRIDVDLTIETVTEEKECDHLGIISTRAINGWLQQIKSLHTIVIVLKEYLMHRGLNVTYQKGLKTYAMIVMVVSYIKSQGLEEEINSGLVFMKLAAFYQDFDQTIYGIDLLANTPTGIFYRKETGEDKEVQRGKAQKGDLHSHPDRKQGEFSSLRLKEHQIERTPIMKTTSPYRTKLSKAQLEIRDPMNHGKIMTNHCYSFPAIKELFSEISLECDFFRQRVLKEGYKLCGCMDEKCPQEQEQKCMDIVPEPKVNMFRVILERE